MLQADPARPVMAPGDTERVNTKKVDEEGGVLYHESQLKASVSNRLHGVRKLFGNCRFLNSCPGIRRLTDNN